MLTCHQVLPGNPNHVDGYIWLHNGNEIDSSDDNYSGTDAKIMEIKVNRISMAYCKTAISPKH